MLKLYTNSDYLNEKNRSLIFPLLLGLAYKEIFLVKDYYCLVSKIEEADIVVLPLQLEFFLKNDKQEFTKLLNLAKQSKIPFWVYSAGDFGTTLYDNQIITFRLGGFKSKYPEKNTFILPSFIPDPYEYYLEGNLFKILVKSELPKIGFVGHANNTMRKWITEYYNFIKYNFLRLVGKKKTDYQSFYPSSAIRFKILMKLQQSNLIDTQFILREKYRAGAQSKDETQKTTEEFFQNMYSNPYVFCMRGVGNFSVRLFETMATGRIPVVINTDCGFPLEHIIDWKNQAVIINQKDINEVANIVSDYHKNISETKFETIQNTNRIIWEKYFNLGGYFKEIHDLYIKK